MAFRNERNGKYLNCKIAVHVEVQHDGFVDLVRVLEPDVILVVPQPHHCSVSVTIPVRAKIEVKNLVTL